MTTTMDQIWADFDALRATEAPMCVDHSEYICSVCNGAKTMNEDGLPVCTECGRCDSAYVSDEPEWRNGVDESGVSSDASRVGAPVNLDHFSAAWGAGTIMTVGTRGTSGNKKLARINFHLSMNHKDRARFHAYAGIEDICRTKLGLQDNVIYQVKLKYRKFNELKLTRGAVRQGVKANAVYQACHEFGIARTTQEIASAFGIPARDLSRTYDIFQDQVPEQEVNVTTPAALISRFFNSINCIPDEERGRTKMKIIAMCKKLEDSVKLMGRTPKAVACAVMFIMLDGKISKAEICSICDVSGPTLGKIEALVRAELK